MASRVDLRGLYPPVRDQGKRGTCVSFATTASHEQHRGQGEELSPEFLHWAAKTLDGVPHTEGTTLRAAAEALANLGQAGESLWHYDERRDQFVALYQPPAAARTDALTRCWTRGGAIPSGVAELRAALDAGRSPLLITRLTSTFHFAGGDGIIAMPQNGAVTLSNHAILIVGYLAGDGEGGGRFSIRNSWGDQWGDNGYGYLPFAYVAMYGIAAWDLGM